MFRVKWPFQRKLTTRLTSPNMPTVIDVTKPPYSATGDGSIYDTKAVQDAIRALPKEGGVLYFPPGTYLLSEQLRVARDEDGFEFKQSVTLRGEGKKLTRLLWDDGAKSQGIYLKGNYYSSNDAPTFIVRDLSLVTKSDNLGTALYFDWVYSTNPIFRSATTKVFVRDIEIASDDYAGNNPKGQWSNGIKCDVAWGVDIFGVGIFGVRDNGIEFSWQSMCKHYLSHISIQGGQCAIKVNNAHEGFHLSNFEFVGIVTGIEVEEGTVYNIANGHIDANSRGPAPPQLMNFSKVDNVKITNVSGWLKSKVVPTNIIGFKDCKFIGITNCSFFRHSSKDNATDSTPEQNVNGIRIAKSPGSISVGHMLHGNYVDVGTFGVPFLIEPGVQVDRWPS